MPSINISHKSKHAHLDSKLLLAFVAVAETGGFTAAAHHLHKTQSTVSLRIRTLETRLGVTLFERSSRALSLTADGRTFLVYARRLLQLQHEAISSVSSAARPMALRFGVPEDYVDPWVSTCLQEFGTAYPAVRPHIHCGMSTDLIEQLQAGALDLALTVRHSQPARVAR